MRALLSGLMRGYRMQLQGSSFSMQHRTVSSHGTPHSSPASSRLPRHWHTRADRRGLTTSTAVHDVMKPDAPSSPEQALKEEGASEQDPAERRRVALQKALASGTCGMGFSAGGFLYCYHLGVLWELAKLGILPPPDSPGAIKLAGASAGALAIATFACGLDVGKATEALFSFAADCRAKGTQGRLGVLLKDFLHSYLPEDAHERCRDLIYVSITTIHRSLPVWRPLTVHQFTSKDDLVQALITSSHVPVYANGQWMTKFRGQYAVDGGVTAFIPSPPTPHVVKVCCFPVSQLLARVNPGIQGLASKRVSALLDVNISPDAHEAFPFSYQQIARMALMPAEDDQLRWLIEKGRKDAYAWASSMKLLQSGTGQEKLVVPGTDKAHSVLQKSE